MGYRRASYMESEAGPSGRLEAGPSGRLGSGCGSGRLPGEHQAAQAARSRPPLSGDLHLILLEVFGLDAFGRNMGVRAHAQALAQARRVEIPLTQTGRLTRLQN